MNTIKLGRWLKIGTAAGNSPRVPISTFRAILSCQKSSRFLICSMSTLNPVLKTLAFLPHSTDSVASRREFSTLAAARSPDEPKVSHSHSHNGVPCGHSHSHSPAEKEQSQTDSHGHSHNDTQHSHDHSHASELGHSHGPVDHDHGHSHGPGIFHSHSHGHNELLTSGSLSNPAVRITWIGLFVNIGMAASKGVGGVYFHSQALIADAIHSVSDMVADFLTLATVNVSAKIGSPTKFPLGYGKIETVGSVFVLGILLFAGVSVGWSSLLQIFEYTLPAYLYEYVSMVQIGHSHSHAVGLGLPSSPDHSHSHSHDVVGAESALPAKQIPNINAAWLAGGSIIVKELLYRKTLKVAEATNSKVLVANAWHHRVDSLTAFVALLTVAGGHIFNVAWLDSVGGLCVSVLIVKAGWNTFKTSCSELIDRGEPQTSEVYATIESAIQDEISIAQDPFEVSNPINLQLKKLSVITSGANTNIYITIATSSKDLRISELNDFESRLVKAIKRDDKFVKNVFVMFKSPGAQ